MVKYALSTIIFQCKQCTEQLVEPYWTDRAHLYRDCYNNGTNIENTNILSNTDVPIEESSIEWKTHTKETPNERVEEQRTQGNDDKHETHQQDPISR